MAPDSIAVELLALAAAVVTAVALAIAWAAGVGWRRLLVRSVAVAACLLSVSATGLLWVNRQVDAYPTWGSVFGSNSGLPAATAATGGDTVTGRIVSFTVTGAASGLTKPMYVYLPPGYATNRTTRYPVIEAFHGYPGSPLQWLHSLDVAAILDREIAARRMAPTVVLLPYQTPDPGLDTECTNLVKGPQTETFLTRDVPTFARVHLRVRTDPAAWGLIGYSAGGYCAADLLLRHPTQYAAAASLSGYTNPGIPVGNGTEHTYYDDAWRLEHLPVPAVRLYLACARTDLHALSNTQRMARLSHSPMSVTTSYVNGGGHNSATWLAMEAPAFDWLSTWLGRQVVGTPVQPGGSPNVVAVPA
jgi:enterochelin esterase-like enzyme